MNLSCINVGYGDAFLFRLNGKSCLIDTGSGMASEYEGYGERINAVQFLKNKKITHIDELILTHIHEDHVGNLSNIIRNFSIGRVWIPSGFGLVKEVDFLENGVFNRYGSRLFCKALNEFGRALSFFEENKIDIEPLSMGEKINIAGMSVIVLGADTAASEKFLQHYEMLSKCSDMNRAEHIVEEMDAMSNRTGLLLKFEYKCLKALFCADNIPADWSKDISEQLVDINFIKIPHHGQADAVNESVMRVMPIEFCVTTASSDRRYNSANPEIYRMLKEWAKNDSREIKMLFTDPSKEYEYLEEVEYGNRSIEFEADKTVSYRYER